MSQCHVHSHLNVMSALLRQQVGLSAGRSTSIHPSFLPTMPAKHPHSTSSTDHAMKCHGDGRCGFVISDRISVSNYTCIRDLILQRWTFFHFSLLEWRHLWGSWKESNMTSLHRNQHAEIICISAMACNRPMCLPWCYSIEYLEFIGELQPPHIY